MTQRPARRKREILDLTPRVHGVSGPRSAAFTTVQAATSVDAAVQRHPVNNASPMIAGWRRPPARGRPSRTRRRRRRWGARTHSSPGSAAAARRSSSRGTWWKPLDGRLHPRAPVPPCPRAPVPPRFRAPAAAILEFVPFQIAYNDSSRGTNSKIGGARHFRVMIGRCRGPWHHHLEIRQRGQEDARTPGG